MANILILGAGAMGTAFAFPCSDNKHNVSIVGTHLENDTIDKLNLKCFHPGLNLKVLDTIKFFKHESIKTVFKQKQDLIVLGVSSNGIVWASDELKKIANNDKLPSLLLLTKGLSLHEGKYELLVDKLKRLLFEHGVKNLDISAIGGPCLAAGLANRVQSGVVVASKNMNTANKLRDMLTTNYYRVSASTDINGVEVCAAIKNIFAMAIGAAPGLNKTKAKDNTHLNTSAALVRQSIYEMEIFVEFLKGKKETVKGLAGLGDLYVSSAGGRNSKMGEYLGKGFKYKKAKIEFMSKVTIEGAELALEIGPKILKEFKKNKIPLMINLINSICNNTKLEINW